LAPAWKSPSARPFYCREGTGVARKKMLPPGELISSLDLGSIDAQPVKLNLLPNNLWADPQHFASTYMSYIYEQAYAYPYMYCVQHHFTTTQIKVVYHTRTTRATHGRKTIHIGNIKALLHYYTEGHPGPDCKGPLVPYSQPGLRIRD
jgi:hypothetical protein